MTVLEQAATALAIRPLLWGRLDDHVAAILRKRIDGQAYTAIAQTLGLSENWTPAIVKKYEMAGCALVLKREEMAITLDRDGFGKRWSLENVKR